MNLIDELNTYFLMNSSDVQEFKADFKEEFLPHAHAENLLNFLLHLDRKIKNENQ